MNINNNDSKNVLISILLMGIVSMTIVFANFTQYLMINAYADVNSTEWNIHFENLKQKPIEKNNTARVITEPVLSGDSTIISKFAVEFNKPGDYVEYTFDIVNAGNINAILSDYVKGIPTCSDNNESFCKNIIYEFKYTDGSDIITNARLKKGNRVNVTMTIKLDESVTSMPKQKVEISNLTGVFYYIQD